MNTMNMHRGLRSTLSGLASSGLALVILLATAANAAERKDDGIDALRARLAQQAQVLQDWPAFARYRADNAALAAPAADAPRVVFLGDSITDFWGRSVGAFFPGKPWVNRGISGQTTAQMLLRFRADVIELKPRALVLLAGTNDIAGNTGPATDAQIEANLASMLDLARAHDIRVALATLLPVTDAHQSQTAARPPSRIVAINDWIRDTCRHGRCVLLDYYAATVDPAGRLRRDLTDDGLHPNARGYAVMQPLAEAAVARALSADASR